MQSLYKVVNFRGVQIVFVCAIWDLKIPPRVQYHLWLMSKNRLLTRDNLNKRKKVEDLTCLFCEEQETVHHLFFDCVVVKQLWSVLANIFHTQSLDSLEDVGKYWLSNKRNGIFNICTSAVFWSIWKLRNDICFQRTMWQSMTILFHKTAAMILNWELLCPSEKEELRTMAMRIKKEAAQVLWLPST